jgi:hypothetical protein
MNISNNEIKKSIELLLSVSRGLGYYASLVPRECLLGLCEIMFALSATKDDSVSANYSCLLKEYYYAIDVIYGRLIYEYYNEDSHESFNELIYLSMLCAENLSNSKNNNFLTALLERYPRELHVHRLMRNIIVYYRAADDLLDEIAPSESSLRQDILDRLIMNKVYPTEEKIVEIAKRHLDSKMFSQFVASEADWRSLFDDEFYEPVAEIFINFSTDTYGENIFIDEKNVIALSGVRPPFLSKTLNTYLREQGADLVSAAATMALALHYKNSPGTIRRLIKTQIELFNSAQKDSINCKYYDTLALSFIIIAAQQVGFKEVDASEEALLLNEDICWFYKFHKYLMAHYDDVQLSKRFL